MKTFKDYLEEKEVIAERYYVNMDNIRNAKTPDAIFKEFKKLTDEFANASGKYFDNDIGRFASPHSDTQNQETSEEIVRVIEKVLSGIS